MGVYRMWLPFVYLSESCLFTANLNQHFPSIYFLLLQLRWSFVFFLILFALAEDSLTMRRNAECLPCYLRYICMYHQQQNKWYPNCVYLPISKLHYILAVANLLIYLRINLWLCYYGQVNSLRLKIECSFEIG